MDGCTMGTDSYFVSTLVGKLLRKIAKTKGYKELYGAEIPCSTLEDYLRSILADLFRELILIKNQLLLEQNDLLTTLLILLVDKTTDQGIILVVGDGCIAVNGSVTEFDQDNKPDYLGFHLHKDFDHWYSSQTQKIYLDTIQDVSIATDGITLFTKVAALTVEEGVDPVAFLLQDKTNADKDDMLSLKLKRLEHVYGLQPGDDLAVIRVIR